MLLTIDVGNTNTVLGLFEGKKLKKTWRVASKKTALFGWIRKAPKGIDRVIISSVVPSLTKRHLVPFGVRQVFFVTHRLKMPIRIRMKNRQEVGADRIANAVGAYTKYGHAGGTRPLVIIDFGTATTFDIVTARGEFIGGAITAGIKILSEALFERCAKLPKVSTLSTKRILGRSTVEAIRSGIFLGYVSLVEGMIARFKKELGPRLKVIATGGLAGLIARECKEIEKTDPFLTLHGLRILYEWNFKSSGGPPEGYSIPCRI